VGATTQARRQQERLRSRDDVSHHAIEPLDPAPPASYQPLTSLGTRQAGYHFGEMAVTPTSGLLVQRTDDEKAAKPDVTNQASPENTHGSSRHTVSANHASVVPSPLAALSIPPAITTSTLAVGPTDTPEEQEASEIAEKLIAIETPPPVSRRTRTLLRKQISNGAPPRDNAPQLVSEVLASRGRPLEGSVRSFMEPRFGHDFSQVRVHTDERASQSAQAVNALAYTVGNNVVFARGRYDPESSHGRRLLAHELTHVVQQCDGASGVTTPSRQTTDGHLRRHAPLLLRQAAPAAAAPASAREKINAALKSGQYLDVADIDDFGPATDAERVSLSRICISGGYVAPQDATSKVYLLWSGMDERLPSVAGDNLTEWDSATKFCPRLLLLPPVAKAKDDFQAALHSLANGNLQENLQFVQARKQLLGLGDDKEPLSAADRDNLRQDIQKTAWHAWELRQEQKKYRGMIVGYASHDLGFGETPWHFDPGHPPPIRATLFDTPPHKHEEVKEAWDMAENEVTDLGNDYPELYAAAMADEDGSALLQLSRVTAAHFGENVGQQLLTLETNIQDVQAMIADGRLELLGLGLLHQAVFQGAGAKGGRNWTGGFDQWAGKQLITEHQQSQEAIRALLKGVEYTALIVGTFAGGLGRLVAMGVAAGAEAFMAGQDITEAGRLQQAARSTPLKGTALVSRVEADAKKAEGIAKMVQAMTTALLTSAAGVSAGLQAARLKALVPDAEQLAQLRDLAKDDAALEDLLQKESDPGAVKDLLTRAGSAARAKEILQTRELFRQRFAARFSKDLADIQNLKTEIPELAAIPDEELVALRGYTTEDYDFINRALRAEQADAEISRIQPYLDNLNSGIERFPVFRGTVSRIESNTHVLYQEGEVVTMQGFTSTCGAGGKVTKQIVGNTSLEIESLTGRDIRLISKHPAEAEVLFAPGKRFLVESKTQPLPGVEWYKVKLKEVP